MEQDIPRWQGLLELLRELRWQRARSLPTAPTADPLADFFDNRRPDCQSGLIEAQDVLALSGGDLVLIAQAHAALSRQLTEEFETWLAALGEGEASTALARAQRVDPVRWFLLWDLRSALDEGMRGRFWTDADGKAEHTWRKHVAHVLPWSTPET